MATPLFRCIDPSHPPGCARCTPAPALEEENDYQLVGDPGRKNGEKKLRALLSRTPEWASQAERNRLAELYEGVAEAKNLSVVLRYKQTAGLRKVHLFLLARAWHYSSDLWVRRDSHGLSAQLNPRPVSAPPALVATPTFPLLPKELLVRPAPVPREPPPAETIDEHVTNTLEPIALESSRLFGGLEAKKALSESSGAVQLLTERFQDMQIATAELSSLLVFWHVQRASLAQWRSELGPDVSPDLLWRIVTARIAPTEEMLLKIDSALRASIATYQLVAVDGRGGNRAASNAAERTWLNEIYRARQLQLEVVSRTVALLAQSKLQSVDNFVRTAMVLLDFLVTFTAMVMSNLAVRQSWMEAMLGSAAAAVTAGGAQAAAQASALMASAAPLA